MDGVLCGRCAFASAAPVSLMLADIQSDPLASGNLKTLRVSDRLAVKDEKEVIPVVQPGN